MIKERDGGRLPGRVKMYGGELKLSGWKADLLGCLPSQS